MKIIYFTTAQDEKDFHSYMSIWKYPLNSSNQNFHNKLIRSLAYSNKVDVISVRPFSHRNTTANKLDAETKIDGNITWHYLKRSGGKINRILSISPQTKRILSKMDLSDAIFVTDTINTSIVRSITGINKKYKRPIIGICTDSPSNISGTKRSYTVYLLSKCENFDGYLALTDGLNNLFNPSHKPAYIFEGLVEERTYKKTKDEEKPYFFFGGALMERYGIYQLIEAYKELNNSNIDLYICGHHIDKMRLKEAIGNTTGIKYLGLLPIDKVIEYESFALACINPRPFSEDLDRFSIPSKTLEYMSSGRPVISVRNSILMEKFPKEIIWANSSNVEDLKESLEKVLSMTEVERENMGEESKNRVLELYSLKNVGDKLTRFLEQFLK